MRSIIMVWNKMKIRKIFLAVAFSILWTGSHAQSTDEKLKLVIFNFKIDTTESLEFTNFDLSSILAKTFEKYDDIIIVPNENYIAKYQDSLNNGYRPKSITGADIAVFGTYIVESGYLKVKPVIFDVEQQLLYPLSFSRGKVDGIDLLMEAVSDNLVDKFVEISPLMRHSYKTIAIVSDFEPLSGIYKNIGPIKAKAEEFTKQMIQELAYLEPPNVDIIPWNQIFEYVDLTPAEVINKLNPDMYLRLKYIFDDQKVVAVKPDFFILEQSTNRGIQKREFELPELKADHYINYDFEEFTVNELYDFLDRIIDESGQWDFIAFPTKSSTSPTNAEALIYKAENFAAKDDFYLSNYQYYEVLNNFSENLDTVDIHLKLGFNKVYLYRLEEAEEEFDYVLSIDSENGYAYLGKSLIAYYAGDYTAAKELLDKANTTDINNKFLTEALKGYYNFELENYNEAKANFESALSSDQGIIKIRIVNNLSISAIKIHIGLCYLALNQYKESIEYYKALREEFPYDEDIPYYLGNAYSKKGIEEFFDKKYSEAIVDFRESKKTYPNSNINDYYRLSLIFEGKFKQANEFIREEIEKGNYSAEFIWEINALDIKTIMLDKFKTGGTVFDTVLGKEAITNLKASLDFASNNPRAYYQIGDIYILIGVLDSGFVYLDKAFSIDPYDFDIQLGLMQAYLFKQDYRQVEKLHRSVSRLNRKLVLDPRTEALQEFMYISASLAQDERARREIKNLEEILSEPIILEQWVPNPYEDWLAKCQCPEDAKKTLEDFLTEIKNHSLD